VLPIPGLFNSIYVSGTGGNQLFENEIWTGTEYQVASGMIEEGLLTEGHQVVRFDLPLKARMVPGYYLVKVSLGDCDYVLKRIHISGEQK
jgi:hypothetical protein